jgi:septal ring factor EnvC (AmiA/AmiB activator)
MLSAKSFGELVGRYKYLHELARHDRTLVTRVQQLRDDIARQQRTLVQLQATLQMNRADKAMEEERLRTLEKERAASLQQVRRDAVRTEKRLAQLRADEARMSRLIGDAIAAAKRREEAAARARASRVARGAAPTRAPAPVGSSIGTADIGRLDWPVEGSFIYDFGRAERANNTQIRWNGVGIGAAEGAPVHAVAAGKVLEVARFGTYGLTVIVEHGGGDYSIYGSLAGASVTKGASVEKGQTLGTVGVSDPDLGPHLHFEIRHGGPAVDPKSWLRARR